MEKKLREPASFYLETEVLNKIKVYCMFKKMKVSNIVQDLFDDYYEKNKVEIERLNKKYDDII